MSEEAKVLRRLEPLVPSSVLIEAVADAVVWMQA